jgi:hypothetical protein
MRKQVESEYEVHAREFAEKCGLKMTTVYLGHYARLSNHITAQYKITFTRPGRTPFMFDFSMSINDSWQYREQGKLSARQGLPPQSDLDKFFAAVPEAPFQYRGAIIDKRKKVPSMYDVLACLTKYAPGSFKNFCDDFGCSQDSISARDTWQAVSEEYEKVSLMFSDVMDELSEIN